MTTHDMQHQFFPARAAFYAHRHLSAQRIRVYTHCLQVFDFTQVRTYPLDAFEMATGVHAPDVSNCLTWLVAEGFLVDHPRGHRGGRRFTLAWSVAAKISETALPSAPRPQVLGKS